jgi:hypothetical protein
MDETDLPPHRPVAPLIATEPPPEVAEPARPAPLALQVRGSVAAARGTRLAEWLALFSSRFILASFGLVVVLFLIVVVLATIGRGATPVPLVVVPPTTTPTTSPPAVALYGGLLGRILETVSVRNGPNALTLTAILGTVPRATKVAVVGRNTDRSWLQIVYPPDSGLRGWMDARYIDVTGDVSQIPLAGPAPEPEVAIPTSPAIVVRRAPPAVLTPTAVDLPTRQ